MINSAPVLTFWVAGQALPQGSTKSFVVKKGPRAGAVITTSTSKGLPHWRRAVIDGAQAAARGIEVPLRGPLEVELFFVFPRLKGHFGKKGLLLSAPIAVDKQPDIDKIQRAIFDALEQSGVILNDGQIAHVAGVTKVYGPRPGVRVRLNAWQPSEYALIYGEAPEQVELI